MISKAISSAVFLTSTLVSLGALAQQPAQQQPGLWPIYEQSIKGAKHIDLTHAFAPVQPVWPGFGLAEFRATAAGADIPGYVQKGDEYTYAKHGFVATSYALTTDQYGTQLDPPAHWDEYGATISDLPPTYAVRPLGVIPIHEKARAGLPTGSAAAAW